MCINDDDDDLAVGIVLFFYWLFCFKLGDNFTCGTIKFKINSDENLMRQTTFSFSITNHIT